MSDFGQGLALSGYGILITFCALGILIGLILLLKVLFPGRGEDPGSGDGLIEKSDHPANKRKEVLRRAAAAGVGVLIQHQSRTNRGSLGKLLEKPVTEWWRKGVDRIQGKE